MALPRISGTSLRKPPATRKMTAATARARTGSCARTTRSMEQRPAQKFSWSATPRSPTTAATSARIVTSVIPADAPASMNSASRTCPNAPISSRVSRTAGPDVTHHGEPGPRADDHGPDPQKCETSVNHEPAYFIAKGITGRRQVCGQRGRRGRGAGGHAFEWYREAIEDEAPASTRRTALRPGPPRQLPGGGSPVTSSRNRGSAKSRKSTI
jgi:hypothetical protein